MNAADLARLAIAKRAFHATEPNASEVQRGVRRARLGLRRSKSPRRWFSKGLVMVVLAVGGLAYAKPQALGELVSNALQTSRAPAKQVAHGTGAAIAPSPAALPAVTKTHETDSGVAPAAPELTPAAPSPAPQTLASPRSKPAPRAAAPASVSPSSVPSAAHSTPDATAEERAVSDWGRVGQALAQGDETKALSALSELSDSDDQRIRDKADLGRAQLFMANGDRDKACSIARALTKRSAGSRIERQAQALLKSCSR